MLMTVQKMIVMMMMMMMIWERILDCHKHQEQVKEELRPGCCWFVEPTESVASCCVLTPEAASSPGHSHSAAVAEMKQLFKSCSAIIYYYLT